MKPETPNRHARAGRKTPPGRDSLQHWIETTLIRALALKANEIHYERGKDGLTVQFRKGSKVVEALGPYRRYQDRAIPRLNLMGRQRLPKRCKDETGRFLTVVDGREWNTPVFHTRTRSGERVLVRFTGSKPYVAP